MTVDGPEAVGRARGLRRTFGSTVALDGVDVDIRPGITGLVGPNGAGKTTLIGLLLGLDRPDGGSVELLGLDPATAGPDVRARVGYAPEYDPLPPDVRAQDLVRLVGELHGLDAHTALERASDVLQRLGLVDRDLLDVPGPLGHDPEQLARHLAVAAVSYTHLTLPTIYSV